MGTDIHPYVEVRRDGRWIPAEIRIPNDRNYWAFAVLANVRNGEGFAGVDTGDPVRPIAEPRGLPADCAFTLPSATCWLGDHSFSWVTLAELQALDLDTPVIQRGMVDPETARRVQEAGIPPDPWCGWTNNPTAVRVQWAQPLREAAWLLLKIIAAMEACGAAPDDTRLVFGFDS